MANRNDDNCKTCQLFGKCGYHKWILDATKCKHKITNMEFNTENAKAVFSVIIDNIERSVCQIEGKEHDGEYKDLWIYIGDGCMYQSTTDNNLVPYNGSVARYCWNIQFRQSNTKHYDWNNSCSKLFTHVEMRCNGKLVYRFNDGTSLDSAYHRVDYLKRKLEYHPLNFMYMHSEIGRKIFYYGLPATIGDVYFHGEGEITVVPDYDAGLTKEEWWKLFKERSSNYVSKNIDVESSSPYGDDDDNQSNYDKEYYEECMTENRIRHGSALQDGNIGWFRN